MIKNRKNLQGETVSLEDVEKKLENKARWSSGIIEKIVFSSLVGELEQDL